MTMNADRLSMIEMMLSQGWGVAKDVVEALSEDARKELLRGMTCMFLEETDPDSARGIALAVCIAQLVKTLPHDKVWFDAMVKGEVSSSVDLLFERVPGFWALNAACAAGGRQAIIMHRYVSLAVRPILWPDNA